MKTKVVHCKKDEYDIYIGRPSIWGNPFEIGKDGDRNDVIEKYKKWILFGSGQHLLLQMKQLENKILGCWCSPQACHGDVIVHILQCGQEAFTIVNDLVYCKICDMDMILET